MDVKVGSTVSALKMPEKNTVVAIVSMKGLLVTGAEIAHNGLEWLMSDRCSEACVLVTGEPLTSPRLSAGGIPDPAKQNGAD